MNDNPSVHFTTKVKKTLRYKITQITKISQITKITQITQISQITKITQITINMCKCNSRPDSATYNEEEKTAREGSYSSIKTVACL